MTMKLIQLIAVLTISAAAGSSFADTISIKEGDALSGKFQTPYIGIQTPYQNLFFHRSFISDIVQEPGLLNQYVLSTINNDLFRGSLINAQIEMVGNTGEKIVLPAGLVEEVHLETPGDTKELETTVFFLSNGDRFSGRLVTPILNIVTEDFPMAVDPGQIARLVFTKPGTRQVEMYMNDGSRLIGEIQESFLSVAPDSAPPINLCTIRFASIQFNALKYIKKIISPTDYIDHDTNTPGYRKLFPEITEDITNAGAGCAAQTEGVLGDGLDPFKPTRILFDTDKSDIKSAYIDRLDRIAGFLKDHPHMTIQINGHTDNVAGADYNQLLSLSRALSVSRYLEGAGISRERMLIKGYGFNQPVADNQSEEGRANNRRVELLLVP